MTNFISNNYEIPANNYGLLEARIEELNKKAKKLKCAPISLEKLSEERREIDTEDGFKEWVIFYQISLTGEAPIINGWTFVLSIEHLSEGNVVRAIPGTNDSLTLSYANVNNDCVHCGKKISTRKQTYVLRNATNGELKQVGSTCLKDFTGHKDPHAIAAYAELLSFGEEAIRSAGENTGTNKCFDLLTYLAWVNRTIREYGWMSKAKAMEQEKASTASLACSAMFNKQFKDYKPEQEDMDKSIKALEWVRNLDEKAVESSSYISNLYVICKGYGIEQKHSGFAASLFVAYDKAMGVEYAKSQKKLSEHQGVVGEKGTWNLEVKFVKHIDTNFGVSSLHIMVDENGNQFKWFSSGLVLEVGKTLKIDGTVKSHDQYEGIKSTMLTRCKEHVAKTSKKKVAVGV
jgi:hypothetical protein